MPVFEPFRAVRYAASHDLAKVTGLGSRYIGNILELLRLNPSILEAIEHLPVGAGNEVTERWLRPIARLPHDEQLTAVTERFDVGREETADGRAG